MSRTYREYISKFRPRIWEIFSLADKKVPKPSILSAYRSFARDSRHLEAVKSSCSRLGNSLHTRVDSSVNKVSYIYDRISGRDIVNKALIELRQAEQDFVASQLKRRTLQQSLFDVQNKRSEVNKQLTVVSRADESFISLITREHELAREEAQLASMHHEADLVERAAYDKFTGLLRYLHGEERLYDQRMRQWALIGSVAAGFFSAFVTWLRFRSPRTTDLRDSLSVIEGLSSTQDEIKSQLVKINETLRMQVDLPQVVKAINNLMSSQAEIMEKLKEFSNHVDKIEITSSETSAVKSKFDWLTSTVQALVKSSNTSPCLNDKPISKPQESSGQTETGYFGWKSVCSVICAVAIIACLI